jgi:hypothetical protein
MIALQLLFTYTRAMNLLFHPTSLDLKPLVLIIVTGLAISLVVGIKKWLRCAPASRYLLKSLAGENVL